MASRRLFFRHTALPAAAGVFVASVVTLRIPTAYAESPNHHIPSSKKPIYDDNEPEIIVAAPTPTLSPQDSALPPSIAESATIISPPSTSKSSSVDSASSGSASSAAPTREQPDEPAGFFATRPVPTDVTSTAARGPTPTDRLTGVIRAGRLQLYGATARAETFANDTLTRALHLESSFTSTVASLAPPASANEPLVPGAVYTLVATMAGSIVSRNRGLLLRGVTPLAFGLGAASIVLPVTMRNVGDLAWDYEKRYPVVADTHIRVKERVERFWQTGKAHTAMGVHMAEDKIEEARKGMQDWVRKGT